MLDALLAGEYCYVLNTRQMGKSSLSVRTIAKLTERGVRTIFLDLTKIGGQNAAPDQWYVGLLSEVGRSLGLRSEFVRYWKENGDVPHPLRLFGAVRDVALPAIPEPVVVFVDEIDAVRSLPFPTDEFFAAVRECHTSRATNPAMARLTFCLLGVATPADLISDTRMSPFNVGQRIRLEDFTPEEAAPLAEGLGPNGPALLSRVLYWTGGNPYLTQRLCRAIAEAGATTPSDVDRLCDTLFLSKTAQESDDNLTFVRNRLLRSEVDLASLLDLYRRVRDGRRVPDDETDPLVPVLRLSGVAKVENGVLKVRNRIYDRVFDREWVLTHLPGAEIRRQKAAFRRGVILTASIAGAVLLVVASLGLLAANNYQLAVDNYHFARKNEEKADYNLYVANMNLIQRDWENNNIGHLEELLLATRKRGQNTFEWNYWNRLAHLELMTLRGHSESINTIAYSPDGKRIVSASVDDTVRVWDAAKGECLLTLRPHSGTVINAVFSADGKRLLTAGINGDDGSGDGDTSPPKACVRVWDAMSGKNQREIFPEGEGATFAFEGHNGRYIFTASFMNFKQPESTMVVFQMWDAKTGKLARNIWKGRENNYLCSPVHTTFAVVKNTNLIEIRDIETGNLRGTVSPQQSVSNPLAVSPDGKRLIVDNAEGSLSVWDITSPVGRKVLSLQGHSSGVTRAVFTENQARLATVSLDGTARIWNMADGRCQKVIKVHSGYMTSVAFSPDGKQIATDAAETIKVWDTTTAQEQIILPTGGAPYYYSPVAFSPDGNTVLTTRGKNSDFVTLRDVKSGRIVLKMTPSVSGIGALAFSSDGRYFAAGANDRKVRVCDAQTGQVLHTLAGITSPITSVGFSPDGNRVFAGTSGSRETERMGVLWDLRSRKMLFALKGTKAGYAVVRFAPDGSQVAVGSQDKTITLWDTTTGKQRLVIRSPRDSAFTLAFSPDGKYLIGGGWEGGIYLWAIKNGSLVHTLTSNSGMVNLLVFTPDGQRIVGAGMRGTAHVWDPKTGAHLLELRGDPLGLRALSFSQNGRRLAAGGDNGNVYIWFADDTRLMESP